MKRFVICLWLACLGALPGGPAQSASDVEQDFLYLEIKRSLREKSDPALDPQRFFALGEYLFELKRLEESASSFHKAREEASSETVRLLSDVYLVEIGRLQNDPDSRLGERVLKEALAKKKFISLFGRTGKKSWESMLKSRYDVVEKVDRLEVYKNGSLFYVLAFP